MSKIYTIFLRKHGETTGLMLYQAKAKSYNSAVLLMKVQGVVPVYDILTYTERPVKEFVLGVLLPRTIQTNNKDIDQTNRSKLGDYFRPIICWFKRQHMFAKYQGYGQYCKRCKGVFPNEKA